MKNQVNISKKFAILILSCDKYSDMWVPFFLNLKKKWPDCPFKMYLGSNTKEFKDYKINTIKSGSSIDWSSDLLKILNQIDEEIIYIWLEDHFPINKINTSNFINTLSFMSKSSVVHIHVSSAVKPDKFTNYDEFGIYQKEAPYRVTVAGFWNKEYLMKLLLPGENPWLFEIMGSYRSCYDEGFFAPLKPLYNFIRIVDKGKITRNGYDYCIKNNLPIDLSKRKLYSYKDMIIGLIKDALFSAIIKISWKKRLKIMNIARRILITY